MAGPETSGVADDPEAAEVLAECRDRWRSLPAAVRERTHLVSVPMDDLDENARVINALQRWSSVVVGLIVTVAAFWKTVIYFLVEISSGLEMTRQSLERGDLIGFLMVAVLPNLFWIVFPIAVVITLGRQVMRVGRAAASV